MIDDACAQHRRFMQIDAAFRAGDLGALRAAVEDQSAIPNGVMPLEIGSCLVYAIYHSPVAFIRELLAIGADPNAPVDDGFPPLIAALGAGQPAAGATQRQDVAAIVALLLEYRADPHVRGINDYTALHMAAALGRADIVRLLLDAGADPTLRTRIDERETPRELAEASGFREVAALLAASEGRAVRATESG
jgi:ankyrin repeat protein